MHWKSCGTCISNSPYFAPASSYSASNKGTKYIFRRFLLLHKHLVLGPTEAHIIDPNVDYPETHPLQDSRRWLSLTDYGCASTPFKDLASINVKEYASKAIGAFNRCKDEAILNGMLGKNLIGDNEIERLNNDCIIPATGTYNKVLAQKGFFFEQIARSLKKLHVDSFAEGVVVAVPDEVWLKILDSHKKMYDYVIQEMQDNFNSEFYSLNYGPHIKIICYNNVPGCANFPSNISAELPKGVDTDKNFYCPMWYKPAVKFGWSKQFKVEFRKFTDEYYTHRMFVQASFGAIRVDPKNILMLEVSKEDESDIF